ncbi:MAG: hypothetical protein R3B70_32105 [Polyangiaceae bacterium]
MKVTVVDGVATVDFEPDAAPYLHQAACAAGLAMSPIEHTLKQFREIREIQWAVGGVVVTEWDA